MSFTKSQVLGNDQSLHPHTYIVNLNQQLLLKISTLNKLVSINFPDSNCSEFVVNLHNTESHISKAPSMFGRGLEKVTIQYLKSYQYYTKII